MRTIYLPTLKKIRISNYTLYPNGLDFEYDFINGVNLIIGGNGMGKTTLVNIIKYAIIGNYTKQFDFTKTYLERKIENRKSFPVDYFKNRMNNSIPTDSKATVTIDFEINNNQFVVERCLEDIIINSVFFNSEKLPGLAVSQKKYDGLKEEEQSKYLQFSYEKTLSKVSGLQFDDLIFFTNEILFFGENHKTVLWNDESPNVQTELFNKYFNSPELDKKRQEAERQAKYFNSLSRHKSEDIRAIQNVLNKVKPKPDNTKASIETLNERILKTKKAIESIDSKIEKKQLERLNIDDQIRLMNNNINELSLTETELDKKRKIAEDKLFESKWIKLHKNYDVYVQNLKSNKCCPMCNKEVSDSFVIEKLNYSNNCFLCEQEINPVVNEELHTNFSKIDIEIKSVYNSIQSITKDVRQKETDLKELDSEFKSLESEKRKLQSELRNLEFENLKDKGNTVDELQAFYDEIELLEKQKVELQEKSKKEKLKADIISSEIEKTIINNTNQFSKYFAEYAGNFLGLECSLTYTSIGDGIKRFYPIIDGKIRYYEEQLSESQRFFIDHSFRLSILTFFYTKPAFYIVETPDSSLDISYEKNAAKVFARFLEKPNSLIITSNLNNSVFINHLIDIASVKMISLLEIGKKSIIQNASQELIGIYNKIKARI